MNKTYHGFKSISTFQYQNMQEMIPKLFQQLWRDGLESDDFSLKLCGAGGGGFILGLTKDMSAKNILTGLSFGSIALKFF